MTMIMTLSNRDNVYLFADRRLTTQDKVIDKECSKAGVLFCQNARFAFGFAGLGRTPGVEVRRWILEALKAAGPPDFTAKNILTRFCDRATADFRTNPALANLSKKDKRLTILFAGYLFDFSPPKIVAATVSNFEEQSKGLAYTEALDEFKLTRAWEEWPPTDDMSVVLRTGALAAMTQVDAEAIRPLLAERRSPAAIKEKATDLMLRISDRSESAGSVGKQITWIQVSSDLSNGVETGYYSNVPSKLVHLPSVVWASSADKLAWADHPSFGYVDPDATYWLVVPRAKPNAPCPCGSRKKYKLCHGRRPWERKRR